MESLQSRQPAGDITPEASLHRALDGWVANHVQRHSGSISELPYDPQRYPFQRLDVHKTEAAEEVASLPGKQGYEILINLLGSSIGGQHNAEHFIGQFRQERGGRTLSHQLNALLAAGQNIALLTPHTELDDVAKTMLAATIALNRLQQNNHNGIVVNKLMTRQAYHGIPVPQVLSQFSSLYWVIPDTGSTAKWDIDEEHKRAVNFGGLRALFDDLRHKKGMLVALAPTGTEIIRRQEGRLELPKISDVSARVLGGFDAYLPVTIWRDKSSGIYTAGVGRLQERDELFGSIGRLGRHQAQAAAAHLLALSLAEQVAELSAQPISYKNTG